MDGGMAFYDPAGRGSTAARAYLITHEQFSDIAAQECTGLQEPTSTSPTCWPKAAPPWETDGTRLWSALGSWTVTQC